MPGDIINIAVLTPYLDGYFFGGLISSIHSVTQKQGVRLIVIQTSSQLQPNEKATYHQRFAFNHMDGVIAIHQGVDNDYINELAALGKPVVLLNRGIGDDYCQYVLTDNYDCVKKAVRHLVKHGHRKIAFVGCMDLPDVKTRFDGYLAALEELSIPYDPSLLYRVSDALFAGGHEAAQAMLHSNIPCTAAYISTEHNAVGLMEKLQEAGYKIPDDIALISHDCDINFTASTTPSLSSIHQDITKLGRAAAENLIHLIRNRLPASDTVYIQSDLILRESCGCSPAGTNHSLMSEDEKNEQELKIIEFFGNTIINNYKIGNSLIKSNSEEIKNLSWLVHTDFHWACLGLRDKKFKYLTIDQFYSQHQGMPSPIGHTCSVEDFPPLHCLPSSTHSGGGDVVWLHLVNTENVILGVVALVGPIDKLKILFTQDTLSHYFDLLAVALEREAFSENRYRNLLDNISQGILSLDENLFIEKEYSLECKRIFVQDIEGLFFPDLLASYASHTESIIRYVFQKIATETDPNMITYLLSLLPKEFIINNRNIHIDYKYNLQYTASNTFKIVLVLTDITDKVKLEEEVEYERNVLKMVVNSVVRHNEFVEGINDFCDFCRNNLHAIFKSGQSPSTIVAGLFRHIHHFKIGFLKMGMVHIVEKLSIFEKELFDLKTKVTHLTLDKFEKKILGYNIESWLEKDIALLRKNLGDQNFKLDNTIVLFENTIKELETKVKYSLPAHECKVILPELVTLRYKTFKSLLKPYSEYTDKLSQRIQKSIHPVEILGGEDIPIVPDKYHRFIKSLVHLFRNAIDHGIEPPDERVENGKSETGLIQCTISIANNMIQISVSDDGRGINPDTIKKTLIQKGLCDIDLAGKLTHQQLMDYIFSENFSTTSHATELSGRGIGLAALKNEVENLNGTISVSSTLNQGTNFTIHLPYQDIHHLVQTNMEDIMPIILKQTEVFFTACYELRPVHIDTSTLLEEQKISLYTYMAYINIKGIVNGKLIISMDEPLAIYLLNLAEKKTDKNNMVNYFENLFLQYTNNIFSTSNELLYSINSFIAIETPTVVVSDNPISLTYANSNIWVNKMVFEQGNLDLVFVSFN